MTARYLGRRLLAAAAGTGIACAAAGALAEAWVERQLMPGRLHHIREMTSGIANGELT